MEQGYARFATTYDLEFGRLEADIPFFTALARRTQGPVLELAVGTGRVAIPVAREGIEVHGLDLSPEMLAVARHKLEREPDLRVTLHEGDMRTFDLRNEGPFRLVYVPARSFLHLRSIEDQLATLTNVRRHLVADGLFAGNLFLPSHAMIARGSGGDLSWRLGHEYVDPASGNAVHVYELARHEPRQQQIHVWVRAEEVAADGRIVGTRLRELRLAWIHRRELEHLLSRAGFDLLELHGDFEGTPLDEGGEEMVWVARPRG